MVDTGCIFEIFCGWKCVEEFMINVFSIEDFILFLTHNAINTHVSIDVYYEINTV